MKRDPALITLSHDHHQALFVAHKLIHATPHTRSEALVALDRYWRKDGQRHFLAEEEILFPAYARHADPSDPLLAQALRDHGTIRERIDALERVSASDVSALSELGDLLQQHVRLEERKLFPRIEAALPAAELAAVANALTEATEGAPPDDHEGPPDSTPPA